RQDDGSGGRRRLTKGGLSQFSRRLEIALTNDHYRDKTFSSPPLPGVRFLSSDGGLPRIWDVACFPRDSRAGAPWDSRRAKTVFPKRFRLLVAGGGKLAPADFTRRLSPRHRPPDQSARGSRDPLSILKEKTWNHSPAFWRHSSARRSVTDR